MRLTCPKCDAKGEIVDMNEDIVFYCPECGLFRDIEMVSPEQNPKNHASKSWILGSDGLRAIEAMVDEGMTLSSICDHLGISRPTMYRYAKESEELTRILGIKGKFLIENMDEVMSALGKDDFVKKKEGEQ